MLGFHPFSAEPFSSLAPEGKKAPSVPIKFGRWASYRRDGNEYIRQVSPGVYLRIRPEETAPAVVAHGEEIGRVTEISLRGPEMAALLVKGIERKVIRKLREEARKPAEVFLPKADVWVDIEDDVAILVALNVI